MITHAFIIISCFTKLPSENFSITLTQKSDSLFYDNPLLFILCILKDFIHLFLEREREREERERKTHVWLPLVCPLLGTWRETQPCAPDWEPNWGPFDSQAGSTQSTEPHQPGSIIILKDLIKYY